MTEPTELFLLISQKLAQELVDYMKTKPYQEVFLLINQMLRLPAAPSATTPSKKGEANE